MNASAAPTIPGYADLSRIGGGGMGTVFRARAADGRAVAVKVLSGTVDLLEFDRERRLLELLGEDAGFVPLLDFGSAEAGPYVVMPLLGGGTLRDRLRRGPLAPLEAAELGARVASALGHAHAKGIVHRDVKPENIIFTPAGRPLVGDVGVAKHFRRDVAGASASVSLSRDGTYRGSVGFMAPEQMQSAKSVGPAADVFALGAILYECLTGEPAFGGTAAQVACKASSGRYRAIREAGAAVPVELASVVERALAPDPRARFADGAELAGALEAVLASLTAPSEEPPRAFTRPVVVAWSLAALALLGLGVVLAAAPRRRDARAALAARSAAATTSRSSTASGVAAPATASAVAEIPSAYSSFARTRRTRLEAVLGEYAPGHREVVHWVSFTEDGEGVRSASLDGTYKTWDLATGRETSSRPEPATHLALIGVSPRGERAVGRGPDRRLALYDVATRSVIRETAEESDAFWAIVAPDGLHALALDSKDLTFWDLETGRRVRTLPLRARGAFSFARDGQRFLCADTAGDLVLTDLSTGEEIQRLHAPSTAATAAAFLDERRVVAGFADGSLAVWDAASGALARRFARAGLAPTALAVSSDARRILVGDEAGGVSVLDAATGMVRGLAEHHQGAVFSLALSKDGARALSGGMDRTVKVWDLEQGRALRTLGRATSEVRALALAGPDRLVAALADGAILDLDVATGRATRLQEGAGSSAGADRPVLSSDGRRALLPTRGAGLSLLELERGDSKALGARARLDWTSAAAFSPDGKRLLVSGLREAAVAVLDAATGDPLATLREPRAPTCFAFTADSRQVLVGGTDATLRLRDLETGETVRTLDAPGSPTLAVAIAPVGSRALSSAWDGELVEWDLETGRERGRFAGHWGAAYLVAYAPDARAVVSAGLDLTVRLWDAASRAEVDCIDLAPGEDRAAALLVSPGGERIYIGTARGVVLVLRVLH